MNFAGSLMISVVVGCGIVGGASKCAAEEHGDVNAPLVERIAQHVATWKAGVGVQEYEYYVEADRIARDLVAYDQQTAYSAALELLDDILAKRAGSLEMRDADFDVGASDLLAMHTLTRFLLGHDNSSNSQLQAKVFTLAKVHGRIRAEIQPNYVRKQVFANVAPPVGGDGIRIAGMNPEAIVDPVAREEYKAAIRENRLNNLMNKRQKALHTMEEELAQPIIDLMTRIAATSAGGATIVRQAIAYARLTDEEFRHVMQYSVQ